MSDLTSEYRDSESSRNSISTSNSDSYEYTEEIFDEYNSTFGKLPIAPINIEISNDNFMSYKDWELNKLFSYFITNIIPKIFKKCNVYINIKNDIYKKILYNNFNKMELSMYIYDFITNKSHISVNINTMCKVINNYVPNIEYNIESDIDDMMHKNMDLLPELTVFEHEILEKILKIKYTQIMVKLSLYKKLNKIVNKNKHKRFRWEKLCSIEQLQKSQLQLEELHELAIIQKIPYFLLLSKRELCIEFAKRFQDLIDGKKRILPSCLNSISIIGDKLNEILPEFFFSYTHNNKVYCDDIRHLYKHFEINGNIHPIDRTIIKDSIVHNIKEWYKFLTAVTNDLLDSGESPEIISIKSQLSSKMASLANKLSYAKNPQLFIDASKQTIYQFINSLKNYTILNDTELKNLSNFTNLDQYKLVLIDLLLIKIKNDTNQINTNVGTLSSVAINISNIYNEIFKIKIV